MPQQAKSGATKIVEVQKPDGSIVEVEMPANISDEGRQAAIKNVLGMGTQTGVPLSPLPPEKEGFLSHAGQWLRAQLPSFDRGLLPTLASLVAPNISAQSAAEATVSEFGRARQAGHGVPYSTAAAANVPLGVSAERMEKAAESGDTEGVLGESVPPALLAAAIPRIPAAARKLRGAVASRMYTPTGELSPVAKAIAHPTGLLETTVKKAFPEPPAQVAARESSVAYEQKAQDLMRRERQQAVLDKQAAVQAKAAGEGPEPFKPFKPSPNVKNMLRSQVTSEPGVPKGPSYENRGLLRGRPGGMAPSKATPTEPTQGLLEGRPSFSEQRITELLRKPVVTPTEAAELEAALGPNWKINRSKGIVGSQASQLGTLRARRAARGMGEPE